MKFLACLAVAACCCAAVADAQPDPAVIAADNAFGLKLLKSLPADGSGNVVISPTSIAMALQIVYNGAQGATRQAMAAALQLNALGADQVNAANQALQASLADPGPQNQLIIANSLWVRHGGRDIEPAFTQINKSYYAAEIGDLAGAPDNVNAWISRKTQGLIPELLPQQDYREAVAIVANAIYFKGRWSHPFDPSETVPELFKTASGLRANCLMMKQQRHLPYFQTAEFAAVRLTYGPDRRLSMLILLPNSGHSLGYVVAGATADSLKHWLTLFQSTDVVLSLPRFKVSYKKSLPIALHALGMGIAFDPRRGDFSGIAPNIYLSDVEHAALVQVDESGTTAAAATSGMARLSSAPVDLPITFEVDHPFLFAILDETSGALLFAGTVGNPGPG
jgi:serine protease inhibitor